MADTVFQFAKTDKLGVVAAVDTSHVVIDVDNAGLLTRVGIGGLVAIEGLSGNDRLIAVIERVTRSVGEVPPLIGDDSGGDLDPADKPIDRIKCALIGTFYAQHGSRKNVFKRGADSFPQIDRTCHFIDAANLQRLMGLLGQGLAEGERLKLGCFLNDASAHAIASGDRFFQRHAALLGSTGAGKSWAVALLLERAAQLKHSNIIVFDLHGEYEPLCDTAKGGYARRFRIAGPGDLDAPPADALFLPYWLLNRDQMLSMLLDRSDMNAPNQASRFTYHVRQLKHAKLVAAGKDEVARTFTVDSPVPYGLQDLLGELRKDNVRKGTGSGGREVKGEWEDKLTRFISRLEVKLEDRRYGFMFQPPTAANTYDWLAQRVVDLLSADDAHPGIKIVDFSEVPADVLPVVTGVFAKLLYDVQVWMDPAKRTPVCVFCDEAHLYLPTREEADAVQKAALGSFERIAKEGRKYGFSLVVVSQRPADVSRTILSQCNNFLALRLTNEADQAVVRRLMPDALAGMVDVLPLLDTGEALLLGDAILLPSRVRLDKPTVEPASSTREFWREWRDRKPDIAAITEAVEALRRQTRRK